MSARWILFPHFYCIQMLGRDRIQSDWNRMTKFKKKGGMLPISPWFGVKRALEYRERYIRSLIYCLRPFIYSGVDLDAVVRKRFGLQLISPKMYLSVDLEWPPGFIIMIFLIFCAMKSSRRTERFTAGSTGSDLDTGLVGRTGLQLWLGLMEIVSVAKITFFFQSRYGHVKVKWLWSRQNWQLSHQ